MVTRFDGGSLELSVEGNIASGSVTVAMPGRRIAHTVFADTGPAVAQLVTAMREAAPGDTETAASALTQFEERCPAVRWVARDMQGGHEVEK